MTTPGARTVRLDIASRFELLELVQTALIHAAGLVGFDEDATHYMSVALRESVINAIKHGNRQDEGKRVSIEFALLPDALELSVKDEGAGFDPERVADPLADENLLKTDGRGIFFMRSFMDEVRYAFPQGGGTEVHMKKRLAAHAPA